MDYSTFSENLYIDNCSGFKCCEAATKKLQLGEFSLLTFFLPRCQTDNIIHFFFSWLIIIASNPLDGAGSIDFTESAIRLFNTYTL